MHAIGNTWGYQHMIVFELRQTGKNCNHGMTTRDQRNGRLSWNGLEGITRPIVVRWDGQRVSRVCRNLNRVESQISNRR